MSRISTRYSISSLSLNPGWPAALLRGFLSGGAADRGETIPARCVLIKAENPLPRAAALESLRRDLRPRSHRAKD